MRKCLFQLILFPYSLFFVCINTDLASGIYIAKLYYRVLSSGRAASISRKLLKTK